MEMHRNEPEDTKDPLVSVIVPVYNSVDLIERCHAMLMLVLGEIPGGAEIIFVDDGSRDGTLDALRAIQARDARVRVVELAGNFGQHAAIFAGFEYGRGQHFVTLDVDLQCDPRDMPRLLAGLAQGYDLVCGVRMERQGSAQRRLFSYLFGTLARRLAGVPLRDLGCSFNALTRELAQTLGRCGELRRFAKPLAARLARRVQEVEVRQYSRSRSKPASSYSATGLVCLSMDFLVLALADVFAWVFVTASAVAIILGLATSVSAIAFVLAGTSPVPLLASGALFILAGLTALLALTGDFIRRVHRQTSGTPFYLIRRVHECPRM